MRILRAISRLYIGIPALALLALAALPGDLRAYPLYSDASQDDGLGNCASCHELSVGGFRRRAALHDAHVNNATATCQLCHTATGDVPLLGSSGESGGVGCIGCHGLPLATGQSTGAGLRRHHALRLVRPDQNGFVCADCHGGDPTPPAESTLPAYYSRVDVIPKSPCNADGKEDFWNLETGLADGRGLDNDGDLLYDSGDPDCAAGPCVDRDQDGYGDPGDPTCRNGSARDCDDAQATVYPGAVEAYDQRDNNCNTEIDEIEGDGFRDQLNRQRYSWDPQPPAGQLYDVMRSDAPQFPAASSASQCLVVATPLAYNDDPATVPPGKVFYYLVRNTLAADYGKASDGTLRLQLLCP